jgi:GDP-fucose protein O-fucosyltransferase
MQSSFNASNQRHLQLSDFFDTSESISKLRETEPRLRVFGVEGAPAPGQRNGDASTDVVHVGEASLSASQWRNSMPRKPLVKLDCTFFKFSPTSGEDISRFWAISDGLVPATHIASQAEQILAGLRERSADGIVVALHVRAEPDWIHHCATWGQIRDGAERDNCFTNTMLLDRVLWTAGVPERAVVYIAGGFLKDTAFLGDTGNIFVNLQKQYTVVFKEDVLYGGSSSGSGKTMTAEDLALNRELYAAIDYEVCNQADLFIGNSVSTFAALLLMSRERDRVMGRRPLLRHFQYNGGGMPLTVPVPLDINYQPWTVLPLKWVFSYTSYQTGYDQMMQVAVVSARQRTRLMPVCIYYGPRNTMYDWLVAQQVHVIEHTPKWAAQVKAIEHDLKV